jgi:hypothetical protein
MVSGRGADTAVTGKRSGPCAKGGRTQPFFSTKLPLLASLLIVVCLLVILVRFQEDGCLQKRQV